MKQRLLSIIIIFIIIISSCKKAAIEKEIHIKSEASYLELFHYINRNKPEQIHPMEYYKEKIIEFQRIIPERRRINVIHKVDNIIPGLLCFLVGFDDFNAGRGEGFDIIANAPPRGNFFGIYTFDEEQNIMNEYQVGFRNYLDNIRNVILEKMPGNKFEYGLISVGDFNNDNINEIASIYLHPPQYEYVFTVFGFDVEENNLIPILFAPVFIKFDQPFPSIEHIKNGFRVLEVLEYEPLELAWINYTWDINSAKYIKQ